MIERRWPWTISGVLLALAGTAIAGATYLWWLPCRGQMLYGAYWFGGTEDYEFSDACLQRMDAGTVFPGPGSLGENPVMLWLELAGVALTGVALLVPTLFLPAPGSGRPAHGWLAPLARGLLIVASLLAVGLGATAAADLADADFPSALLTALVHGVGLSVLGSIIVVLLTSRGLDRWCWLAALGGVAAFSFGGLLVEYVIMISWSDANWDSPPGSGYPTAGWLLVCGLAIIVLSGRRDRSTSASESSRQALSMEPA